MPKLGRRPETRGHSVAGQALPKITRTAVAETRPICLRGDDQSRTVSMVLAAKISRAGGQSKIDPTQSWNGSGVTLNRSMTPAQESPGKGSRPCDFPTIDVLPKAPTLNIRASQRVSFAGCPTTGNCGVHFCETHASVLKVLFYPGRLDPI